MKKDEMGAMVGITQGRKDMAREKQAMIQAAIQLERDGRKSYLDIAAKTSNAMARKMFESLADDELRHIERLQQLSPGHRTAEEVNKELYQRLSHIFADMPEEVRRTAEVAESDVEALNLAIDMEVKSREAYLKWAAESDTEELRTLCNMLAEEERFHEELLENTREYLAYSIDWFLQDKGVVELG